MLHFFPLLDIAVTLFIVIVLWLSMAWNSVIILKSVAIFHLAKLTRPMEGLVCCFRAHNEKAKRRQVLHLEVLFCLLNFIAFDFGLFK